MMHDAWLILPITSNNRIQASVTELHNIIFICLYNSGFSIRKETKLRVRRVFTQVRALAHTLSGTC